MAFQLRPYQQTLLRQVQDSLAANPNARPMLQLPTGGGKTVIAGALLSDWLRDGRKAVWLTHRKELAEQTRGMLTDAGVSAITNVNWTPGEDAPAMSGGAVILMAQTVGRRAARFSHRHSGLPHRHSGLDPESRGGVWNRYGPNDLLVIDEAHHAAAPGWERAMQQWPGPVVGMTGTPGDCPRKKGLTIFLMACSAARRLPTYRASARYATRRCSFRHRKGASPAARLTAPATTPSPALSGPTGIGRT